MNASDLFKAGKLQEAVAAQTNEVKSNPLDQNRRLFLFELLAFAGDLDRATRQIDALKYEQMELAATQQGYRRLLDGENLRRRLFSQSTKPEFFAPPPEHVHQRLEAVNRLREGDPAAALALLEPANAAVPALRGTFNGKPFDGLRDGDDLFAGILEVMAHGIYYWVPFDQIISVSLKGPRFPRDLLWLPARLELEDAGGEVFLPALYPNSYAHPDDQVKLGRTTDWQGGDGGPVLGVGLRTFLVGDEPVLLPEWRELQVTR